MLNRLYYGQVEDNCLEFFDYDEEVGFYIRKLNKNERKERGLERLTTSTMEGKFFILQSNPTYSDLSKRVYQYYRYFSQYEHFSENGQGDVLIPFGEDNVHFPSAMKVIEDSVVALMKNQNSWCGVTES